jgi:hypothetical protein
MAIFIPWCPYKAGSLNGNKTGLITVFKYNILSKVSPIRGRFKIGQTGPRVKMCPPQFGVLPLVFYVI